jgi:energy-converting hydrogenase Eha subunit E
MPTPDRSWAGAAVVALLGGVLAGVGGLLAILGFNGPLALVYAVAAVGVLTAFVARAAPPDERDEDFWLKVGGLVALGLLAAGGAGFLGFLILWNSG